MCALTWNLYTRLIHIQGSLQFIYNTKLFGNTSKGFVKNQRREMKNQRREMILNVHKNHNG